MNASDSPSKDQRLRDCPFCGKTQPVVHLEEDWCLGQFYVVCNVSRGGCGGSGGYACGTQEAIRNWSGR